MSTSISIGIASEQLRTLLIEMLRIRLAEETIVARYPEQEMRCPTHLSIGQEAVAAGVCQALELRDSVFSGHRCHAHYLAKGGSFEGMFAELYGKVTGCCGGKGGSMHLASPETGMLGSSAIVAGTVPVAVGRALASTLAGRDEVSVTFFGDAAVEQGVTHESLAFAALRKLPVIFVCENNGYATASPLSNRQVSPDIWRRAEAHAVPGVGVDGNDVVAVYRTAQTAVARARRGDGPTFIEAKTYRWLGHVGPGDDFAMGYRTREEMDAWRAKDPIATYAARLEALGVLTGVQRRALERSVQDEIDRAVEFAKASPFPEPDAMYTDVL
jgi:pyruvate dehydrogenase E1 component alpha subunit